MLPARALHHLLPSLGVGMGRVLFGSKNMYWRVQELEPTVLWNILHQKNGSEEAILPAVDQNSPEASLICHNNPVPRLH